MANTINCNGEDAIDFDANNRFKLHPRFKNRGFSLRNAIIFLFLVIFPFGQLLRINLNIFNLAITLQPIDLILLLSLIYVAVHKNKLPSYIIYFLISSLFSFLFFTLLHPSKLLLTGLLYFIRFVAGIGFFLFISVQFKTEKQKLNLLNCLIAVIAVVGIFGWLQYFLLPDFRPLKILGWDDHLFRLIGTFLDPTYTGIILVLGFFMTLGSYSALGKKSIWLILFFLVTVAFTYSRASYLALVGGLIFFAFWKKKYLLPFLIIGVFSIIIVLLPRPSSEGVQLERTQSIYGRFRSYSEGLSIFKNNPVFGVGFNNYCYAKQIYLKSDDLTSHSCSGSDSSILNILATTGVVGLLIFVKMLSAIYKRVKNDMYGTVFVICSISLFIHSFFSNSLFYTWVLSLMAILAGLAITRNSEE